MYFRSGDRELKLGCGALFWHLAGEETIHRTESGSPYECLALAFAVSPRAGRPAPRVSVIPDHQRARELCREFLLSYHDDAVDRGILGGYAHSRLLWESHRGTVQHPESVRPPAVEAALVFLEAGFRRHDLGVGDLAKSAGISTPHVHALFRKHLSQTPHQFLTARRIREAKWLLSGTNRTIKAIAIDCGFPALETFYRAFKRTVGTTPHQFRASHSRRIFTDL
ncbi:MAG: helix-turn-helix transcriptional regulator [Verrucomicrobiae bacterium]